MSDRAFWKEAKGLTLSAQEAARALGISARTLWAMTSRGAIPHVRVGRRNLYPIAELRAWLARNIRGGTSSALPTAP